MLRGDATASGAVAELLAVYEIFASNYIYEISQTQLISKPAQHNLEDNISRELEEIEWSAGPLIGSTPTSAATKLRAAEIARLIQFRSSGAWQ
jgi:hypothetical protein